MTIDQQLEQAAADLQAAKDQAKKYIDDFPLSGRKKAALFGWGEANYGNRMKQNISVDELARCLRLLQEWE